MLKFICLISFILLSGISKVNTLECYSCTNCNTVNDQTLVETCGATTTTQATSTPSGGSTTTTPSGGSTTTTPSGGSTTTTPSTGSTTTTPSAGSTTTTPSAGSTTTTPSGGSTTTTPSGGTSGGSTMSSGQTTTTPSGESASTTTTSPTGASASPGESPATAILEPTDENIGLDINDFRAIRTRREIMRADSNATYVCVTLTLKENNTESKHRGCGLQTGTEDVCVKAQQELNATCSSCNTNKCNSAGSLQISLFLVFVATLTRFVLFK